jgi:hypothetical protein
METEVKIKTDEYGFNYLEELPEESRIATIDDFHISGLKKVSMQYFLESIKPNKYYIKMMTEHTTGLFLKKYIDRGQVWVNV